MRLATDSISSLVKTAAQSTQTQPLIQSSQKNWLSKVQSFFNRSFDIAGISSEMSTAPAEHEEVVVSSTNILQRSHSI